jgi:hypothetical protein
VKGKCSVRRGACGGAWLSVSAPRGADDRGPRGRLGGPGLWKPDLETPGGDRLVFDCPLAALLRQRGDHEIAEETLVEQIVAWSLATLECRVPEGWKPPGPERLEALLPRETRSIRFGAFIAQVEIAAEPGRLALRVPMAGLSSDLTPARRVWLDTLLDDAARLRMVRVGVREDLVPQRVEAEVDLSGAPSACVEGLVVCALEALRLCYRSMVLSFSVVAGGSAHSRAMEQAPETWLVGHKDPLTRRQRS